MLELVSIIGLVSGYHYLLLFPIAVAEGPVITVVAGFLASTGVLNIYVAYAIAVAANLVSDGFLYVLGRWGGRLWKYFGFKMDKISSLEKHVKEHKIKTLLAGKLVFGVGNVALVAAGVAKMPYLEYLGINLLIEIPKSIIYLLVGYYFGQAYVLIDKYLHAATQFLIFGSLGLVLIYWLVRKLISRRYKKDL